MFLNQVQFEWSIYFYIYIIIIEITWNSQLVILTDQVQTSFVNILYTSHRSWPAVTNTSFYKDFSLPVNISVTARLNKRILQAWRSILRSIISTKQNKKLQLSASMAIIPNDIWSEMLSPMFRLEDFNFNSEVLWRLLLPV